MYINNINKFACSPLRCVFPLGASASSDPESHGPKTPSSSWGPPAKTPALQGQL